MRIGIDGRELAGNRTGVGRYLAELVRRWIHDPAATRHHLVIYTAPGTNLSDLTDAPNPAGARIEHRPVPGEPGAWWEQTSLARATHQDALDVFFGPGYSLPLRSPVPCVVTLHDISFTAHPEWFGWREGLRRRWLAKRAASRAVRIVTVSQFARDEIIRHFDLDGSRVAVVYNGVSPPHPRRGVTGTPTVLYVGSLFNRRHLPTLIRAFAGVARHVPDATLAVVGVDRTYPPQDLEAYAHAAGVADRVRLHGHLPDDDLAELYGRARVFVFLSEYEGFGMTPLEALAAGVPLVVGDTTVAHEVYGGAARFVPVDDPNFVAREIITVMRDDAVRAGLLAHAPPLLARFTWDRAAAETLAVLVQATEVGP